MDPQEARKLHIEVERQKKWLKMLKNWDTQQSKVGLAVIFVVADKIAPHLQEKLHSRVYKGIPNSLRSEAWCKLLQVDKLKKSNKGQYQEMMILARKYSTDARQIDSDVNRQFR